jgi:hypothetical protein
VPSVLNNVTTTDKYTGAATLACAGSARINLDVLNAAVYFQLGHGTPGIAWESAEVFMPPAFRSLDRACDAVRVRSALAGIPAQVTIHAATKAEIG